MPTINPILSITWPYGEEVYTNKVQSMQRVVPKGVAYMVWNILNKRDEISPYRREFVSYAWFPKYAVKTGTTDIKKDDVVYPKEWYVVIYNPNDTILSRAWNVDSTPLNNNVLGSQITKPFIQSYISLLGEDSFRTGIYDRPNDLWPWDRYLHTQYNEVPKEISSLIWN